MKEWYANELSKLTAVSVRTLHYYDKIDLLKPSLRLANGYRLYSEKDLLKLQQIIALKFFGFELTQIKTLLAMDVEVREHFLMQAQFLQEKAETLMEASNILRSLMTECSSQQSIPWEKIIQLIEVYRMEQQLENTWVSKVLNPDELKQYVAFERRLKTRYSDGEKKAFDKAWFELVAEIARNLDKTPESELGINIGQRCMALIDGLYGKENRNLRTKIWEEGFKKGKNDGEHGMSAEVITWLDKAIDSYWRHRIYSILADVGKTSSSILLARWNEVLDDMYGDEDAPKKAITFAAAFQDEKISPAAKEWLKKYANN